MKNVILYSLALIFLTLAGDPVYAQGTDKSETDRKPQTTTVDAWREAAPLSEQPMIVTAAPNEASEVTESSQQIEKRISSLETSLSEYLKTSNSEALRELLADDFVPVGRNLSGKQASKNGFIDWVLKNGEHKLFTVENIKVRVYGTDTAIATVQYKKVTNGAAGAVTEDGFVATDVWVKRGNLWQAASHHISPLPKQ